MKNENSIAKVCKTVAVIIWILAFIVGIIAGVKLDSAYITGYIWSGCFISGLFFFAFGELLQLLHNICLKINPDSLIVEQFVKPETFVLYEGSYTVGDTIRPYTYYLKVLEGYGEVTVTNPIKNKVDIVIKYEQGDDVEESTSYSGVNLFDGYIVSISEGMKVVFEVRNSESKSGIVESLLVKGEEINT